MVTKNIYLSCIALMKLLISFKNCVEVTMLRQNLSLEHTYGK